MINRLTFFIGARYGISRRHSRLVSFISTLSTVGLVIGVALLIVVLSIMNGFDRELRERILGIMPQATLYHSAGSIADTGPLIDLAMRQPHVLGASPFVQVQGLVSWQRRAEPVNLFGIEPALELQYSALKNYLPARVFDELSNNPQALVLGKGIADKLQVAVGQTISLVIPASGRDGQTAPRIRALDVIAILDSGTGIDQYLALMGLSAASSLTPFPGEATGIRLQLDDLFAAPEVMRLMVNELPSGYYGSNWTRTQGNLYEAIHMSKRLVELLLFLIIAIAAFNLVSTLIMVVVDKQGDIAILRTLGASTSDIVGIFMVQGGLIGLIGTSAGIVLGVGLSLVVTDLAQGIERITGIQFLHSDVYPISYLPSDLQWGDVIYIGGTALAISVIASLYPAWRASRVQPAEALRYE
ncbi:lipoprotein-releasing ABC transporter permease subunit [Cellvibrio polysaccharolyticus]|uniref:Lipoprotein-releasing ABC transporter permease subunit n=1 Tax=Cellvibrio polysaccharolyticus TaxID=2082724 RepID=A0A928V588_9GAMM|nr:lipoprotein-releasing ABC transporter permease subunit [Cellvibrio polysaccharolyticus]MBE8717440.1 lipoprotein-releasing ABC transporter permease subunit [Cellvibrio polysaccharolyticus]